MPVKARVLARLSAGVLGISIALLAARGLYRYRERARIESLIESASVTFGAVDGRGMVRVPFTLQSGIIVVQGTVEHHPVQCVLDTGLQGIEWPEELGLPCRHTGGPAHLNAVGGHNAAAELVMLPSLTLGGYRLSNVPSLETALTRRKAYASVASAIRGRMALGSWAFERAVVTIDYRSRELSLRPGPLTGVETGSSSYNCGSWSDDLPVVKAIVRGRPIRVLVDTGGSGLAINPVVAQRLFGRGTGGHPSISGAFGAAAASGLPPVTARVGRWTVRATEVYAVSLPGEEDATFGYDCLRHFRVTIDYPGRCVLLEPVALP